MYMTTNTLTFQEQVSEWATRMVAALDQPKIIQLDEYWAVITRRDIIIATMLYLALFFAAMVSAYKVGRESAKNELQGDVEE